MRYALLLFTLFILVGCETEAPRTAGVITKVGTATFTANNPTNLTGVVPAITATGITGDNSATWNPTINVFVAGGMAAGVYSGTITQSVS